MLTNFCDPAKASDLFRLPPICFQNEGDGGGAGGGAPQGGAGDGGAAKDKGKDDGGNAGDKGKGDGKGDADAGGDGKPKGDEPVTSKILHGVLDAHRRTSQQELKKLADQQAGLQGTLEKIQERLETLGSSGSGDADDGAEGKKKKSTEDTEKVELKRQLSELKKRMEKTEADRVAAEGRERDYKFETRVKAALVKAGCTNPEEAFLVIRPRLKTTEEGVIFAAVKSQWGDEDLNVMEYIEREFSENILPQLFKGKMRQGSPAGGDAGDGGGGHLFTREQIFDPEVYAKDPEKARAALEHGQVRGVPKPGGAK